MSLTVVGSIAFDAVQTPHGGRERMLGGAATHFSLAASFFDEVRVVALCGSGGYAEYAVAPAALTFPIPDAVGDETALAIVLQGLTAWHLYRTCARVAPGESVVVHSAAGGVGSLAVQLGHALGAGRVIAPASTPDKRALALELGADAAVDGAAGGLTERLVEANGGRPVDAVFEMAGGAVFDASLAALAPFGRLVIYGIASGEANTVRSGSLMRRSRAVVGFWFVHCLEHPAMIDDALADLFARVARGELRVVTGPAYPLHQAARAQTDLAARRTTGKVTLDPTA
jgi:NADPH2:quinone reductase